MEKQRMKGMEQYADQLEKENKILREKVIFLIIIKIVFKIKFPTKSALDDFNVFILVIEFKLEAHPQVFSSNVVETYKSDEFEALPIVKRSTKGDLIRLILKSNAFFHWRSVAQADKVAQIRNHQFIESQLKVQELMKENLSLLQSNLDFVKEVTELREMVHLLSSRLESANQLISVFAGNITEDRVETVSSLNGN